jgi:hypothetical protein
MVVIALSPLSLYLSNASPPITLHMDTLAAHVAHSLDTAMEKMASL